MIIVNSGDLVISGINVEKGAIAVHQGEHSITATIHYSSYQFDDSIIDIDFLKRFLRSPAFISALKEQTKGGIKTEIKAKTLLSISVQLPLLSEQQAINHRFETFENELVQLASEIDNQKTYLTKLRQAILQEAIEGKLTADWRINNPVCLGDPNTDAAALLASIKAEKQKLIVEGKIKKEKPLAPINPNDLPFSLPDGWVWVRLGEVGQINPRNYINDDMEVSFIPMRYISEKYGISALYEIKKWSEIKSGFTHFADGDISIAKITPCYENSKSCVFNKLKNGFGAGTTELHIIRPIIVNSYYIYIFIKTSNFIQDGARLMTGAVGQKRVPANYVSNSLIPLPPLSEQQAITNRVDSLLNHINALEQQVTDRKHHAEQLMQAVLKEAFAG